MEEQYLKKLYKLAKKAYKMNNVPVAALIVKNNKIISKAYNKKNSLNISVYHAEILAIIKACRKLKTWRLDDCIMYVTLQPCNMCKFAISEARISTVKYIIKSNYEETEINNLKKLQLLQLQSDYEFLYLIQKFFEDKRNRKK